MCVCFHLPDRLELQFTDWSILPSIWSFAVVNSRDVCVCMRFTGKPIKQLIKRMGVMMNKADKNQLKQSDLNIVELTCFRWFDEIRIPFANRHSAMIYCLNFKVNL